MEKLNITYHKDKQLDIYLPSEKMFKTIIFFHGGGLNSGQRNAPEYVDTAHALTKHGYAYVSVSYSLYPNAKFPDYLLDAAKAIKYVITHISELGGNPNEIYISGQSAGAWMIMMLCTDKHYLLDEGVNSQSIKGWISDSACLMSHFNIIQIEDHLNPLVQRMDNRSPIYFMDEHFKSNPILLICYENDMPNRKQQNELALSVIKNLNSLIDVTFKVLPGSHCHGSTTKNIDGTYDYVETLLSWLKTH